jgi:hypothetical protein
MTERTTLNPDDALFGEDWDADEQKAAEQLARESAAKSYATGDKPLGLTQAFKPVGEADEGVAYDKDDRSLGLAQAFGSASEEDEWKGEAGKWDGFDWDAAPDGQAPDEPASDGGQGPEAEGAEADAAEGAAEGTAEGAATAPAAAVAGQDEPRRAGGRHAAAPKEDAPHIKASKRHRKALIVAIVLVIVLLGALGYFFYNILAESGRVAEQHTQGQPTAEKQGIEELKSDAESTTNRTTEVPKISGLLGKTTDEAVSELAHGATITLTRDIVEEGNPIRQSVTVALTEEPADTKTGIPTVYLGLDVDGKIVQVGYSASASALGFGALSFEDAVNNEHAVEKTLRDAGVEVQDGAAVLPQSKSEYSTYESDGTTLSKERCSFTGDITVDSRPCTWSAVLSYDYKTANLSGNLSDTVRIIYAYLTATDVPIPPMPETASGDAAAASEAAPSA